MIAGTLERLSRRVHDWQGCIYIHICGMAIQGWMRPDVGQSRVLQSHLLVRKQACCGQFTCSGV
jgi:hypothetical protein